VSHIIAVDGPAGSGKSSVSKAVARRLGFGYLDTGAAYRVLTASALTAGIDLDDESVVVQLWESLNYQAPTDPDGQIFVVNGEDFTDLIRAEGTSSHVSRVAKHPRVRQAMNEGFRSLADSIAQPGIVIEGRDITTVVAPDAPVRVLLTADEDVRIARRQAELGGADASSLTQRDNADRKVVDFMTAADGVVTLDSTHLSFDDTISALLAIAQEGLEGGMEGAL
jgi:cytidylate kinase